MPSIKKLLQAAAGNAGESLYVEDVFSTYLYTGTGSNQTITNGIDFSGDGGLVWLKNRVSSGTNNVLLDTERGGGKFLYSNTADSELDFTGVYGVTFNNNGFTLLDTYTGYNTTGETAVSWSFRKAEKFFDVVTYTGNGTAGRTVSHNLGSVPGCVIVKSLGANNWQVYHNGLTSAAYSIWLNSTSAEVSAPSVWNSTAPASTVFTVGSSGLVNNSGTTYVAYLFASDAGGFGDDGDESIISCGSYTGNGSTTGPEIDLGFEPQWLMVKRSDDASNWSMKDIMRGFISSPSSVDSPTLYADSSAADGESANKLKPLATGFQPCINHSSVNTFGGTYIYIAIRRPMKTPESGTEVFLPYSSNPTSVDTQYTTGFVIDMVISGQKNSNNASDNWTFVDRLRGFTANSNTDGAKTKLLLSTSTDAETTQAYPDFYNLWNTGAKQGYGLNGVSVTYQFFRRARGVFDAVAYTGTGATHVINHNLGVTPELIIVKGRSFTVNWLTWHTDYPDNYMLLNSTVANQASGRTIFDSEDSSSFTLGSNYSANGSGQNFIAYLFATLAGVSKVGSYTGTAATLNVDCGFSAGARFVLIKRTDSTGDWYVWDSARGIVSGNDPYLLLNSIGAEVTNTDYVDPLNAGFTVTSSASSTVNVSSGSYIFLAIA